MNERLRIEITAPVIVAGRGRQVGDVVELHPADAAMFERTGRGVRTDKPLTEPAAVEEPPSAPRKRGAKPSRADGKPAGEPDASDDADA